MAYACLAKMSYSSRFVSDFDPSTLKCTGVMRAFCG